MSHNQTRRRVVIPDMSLKLSGVTPAIARKVAADLPQAVTMAMSATRTAQDARLSQTDQSPAAITVRLANEIAGRIQSGLAKHRQGGHDGSIT